MNPSGSNICIITYDGKVEISKYVVKKVLNIQN